MEEILQNKVLLVGEGDFSFTVSLMERLKAVAKILDVTSSSIESEDSIKKHKNAEQNVQRLKSLGADVKLNTDATQLHINQDFMDRKFNQVVFNFPHAGGKSNHKKNRKLLNDFFASAVQVLSPEGQILVTLCKGQGGTPADKPQRAWHDSWQVVSMAANAGLILTDVRPFHAEKYTAYSSTGFRSLDKGFHTENALTNVFEVADVVEIPADLGPQSVKVGGHVYTCSRYLFQKLQAVKHVNGNSNHPIHTLYQILKNSMMRHFHNIQSSFTDLGLRQPIQQVAMMMEKDYVTMATRCVNGFDGGEVQNDSDILENKEHGGVENYLDKKFAAVMGSFHLVRKNGEELEAPHLDDITEKEDCSKVRHHLTLLDVSNMCQGKNQASVCYGPVFRRCKISEGLSTVAYYMTLTLPWLGDRSFCEQSFSEVEKSVEMSVRNVVHSLNTCRNESRKENCHCCRISIKQNDSIKNSSNCCSCDLPIGTIHLKKLNDHVKSKPSENDNGKDIGEIYFLNCEESEKMENTTKVEDRALRKTCVCLNLSQILCLLCSVSDERLLWSTETTVVHRLEKLSMRLHDYVKLPSESSDIQSDAVEYIPITKDKTQEGEQHIKVDHDKAKHQDEHHDKDKHHNKDEHQEQCFFQWSDILKPVSLYPMNFIHDMSFWENNDIPFDELLFCDVIRDIVGDVVTSVELLDKYLDTVSSRTSRCYRLTFQSVDKCLSYDISWKLQSIIRLEVQKRMNIILR